jgi:hypothetical protein
MQEVKVKKGVRRMIIGEGIRGANLTLVRFLIPTNTRLTWNSVTHSAMRFT